ncbi:MAG: hypothetical protein E7Z90_03460 [Cyanobacteria bacterium SIG29]|nr:hypothetical protein [Cyanobacteria bacterium SIG29]
MLKKYDFIFSIGEACSCTQLLRENDLQFASYPLDWVAGSNFEERINLFLNQFKNYINKDDLEYAFYNGINDCNAYYNKQNDFTFNHDFSAKLDFNVSYDEVKSKYNRRIERLYSDINKSNSILMVWVELPLTDSKKADKSSIVEIFNKVLLKYPNKKFDLLYIVNNEKQTNNIEKLSDNVTYVVSSYKDKKSEFDYAVKRKKLTWLFNKYTLNLPFGFLLKRKIQRLFVNLIFIKSLKKKLRKKFHLK